MARGQLSSDQLLHTLEGHAGAVLDVAFTRNGRYLMSASQDKTLKLWNPHSGLLVKTFTGPHSYEVNGVAITEDNRQFVSCGGDKQVLLWDVASAQVVRKFAGHDRTVNALALGPEDALLISASHDRSTRIWDLRAGGRPIQTLGDSTDSVLCVEVSGDEIITGSVDGGLRRYDVRKGQLTVDELIQPISCVSLSNDGQCVLVSTLDDRVTLLERATGHQLASYTGHSNRKFKLQSTLDTSEAFVISGSEDNRICLWDLVEPEQMSSVKVHEGAVMCARCCGAQLVTGSADGCLKVWRFEAAPS